ncbi:MAG TPA: DUF4956 domain-containing protein [bacterium]|jgi:uncharacterized membrane protein YhiD involved in acid resistance|nr:DUF4956 domain-containing protein [bacterium]HOC88344.1 DUF4956 domain-containing protein [bacterium]HOZ20760.1 DUF4956 domain-containing protein [bacterium]
MLQEFSTIFVTSITFEQVATNLLFALVCGLTISWIYRLTYRGPGFAVSFVHALIYLAMITAVVIMVIGNNLARAFGLVGAMSIIRFRTAVKDTADIVFIFFSLAIGMAAGVGMHKLAIGATMLIGLVMILMAKSTAVLPMGRKFLLQFSLLGDTPDAVPYEPILKQYCRTHKLINVKTEEEENLYEISFYVDLRDEQKHYELVKELRKLAGMLRVNLFYDEEAI